MRIEIFHWQAGGVFKVHAVQKQIRFIQYGFTSSIIIVHVRRVGKISKHFVIRSGVIESFV